MHLFQIHFLEKSLNGTLEAYWQGNEAIEQGPQSPGSNS